MGMLLRRRRLAKEPEPVPTPAKKPAVKKAAPRPTKGKGTHNQGA